MSEAAPALVALRPMGIGDILDATFRLYKAYLVPFVVIALVAYLPYAVYTLAIGLAWPTPELSENETPEEVMRVLLGSPEQRMATRVGDFFFFIFVFPLVQAAMTFAISSSILGTPVTAVGAFGQAKGRMWPLLGTQIVVGIVLVIGYILLIVPGIIFSLWFLITVPIVVLERLSGSKAMSRSRELMRDNLGKGFLLMLVVGVLSVVITLGAAIVLGMLPIPSAIAEAMVMLIQAAVLPFTTAPVILLYYDLRVRKEAFDLERLADAVQGRPHIAMV